MSEEQPKILTTSKGENSKNAIIGTRIFSTSLLTIVLLILSAENILAQSLPNQRTLSLDSRYVIPGYSNRAVGQFGIEIINLATLPADLIIRSDSTTTKSKKIFLFYDSHQLRNVGNGLILFIGSAFLSNSFTFSYHEFGHGTRSAAVGLQTWYSHQVITSQADYQGVLSGSIKSYVNFFPFYISSLFNQSGSSIIGDTLFSPLTKELDNGWDGVMLTGGLNNEMLFTEYIEDELYRRGGHIGFLIPYISGKIAALSYGTGYGDFNDVTNIINYYQGRGFDIDSDKINNGNKVSLFTSTLSYQFVYQFFRMLSGKSSRFYPWKFRGLELPNSLFYMNRDGLSYQIRSGYNLGEWRFPFAVEHVYEGKKRTEISFGAEKQFDKLTTTFEATVGKRLEFAIDVSYRQNEWFMISGGYELYDKRNLHGERLIPRMEHGPVNHQLYLKASLIY
jgi:hypothetical protein